MFSVYSYYHSYVYPEFQIGGLNSVIYQVDDVQVDGLMPTCLKPAERNKNSRQTVRVSSFYESDAQTFEKRHTFKVRDFSVVLWVVLLFCITT